MEEEYKLVCELYAHEGPVRCLSLGPSGELVSGCQTEVPNIRRWNVVVGESRVPEMNEVGAAIPHDHWVTALTLLPAGGGGGGGAGGVYPDGAIVTGCEDKKIRVFGPSGELMLVLEGHDKGVISLSWTSDGKLISGSKDGTAKIWDLALGGVCVATLDKHENGVNVLGLANGQIITTSTGESVNSKPDNFFIRYWDSATGKQLGPNIKDHTLSIKSIAPLTAIDAYATSANDGTVRIRFTERTASGEASTLGVLRHPLDIDGTPSYLHHVTALTSSTAPCDLVSCAEDGSVTVWNSSQEMQQVLPHPAAVWCALALSGSDGDFVTGGDDGIIRMFSKNPQLTSTMSSLQLHDTLLASVQAARNKRGSGPTAEELAKCPKWDDRGSRVGKKEGDVCLFNRNGEQIAAQWSVDSATWIMIGSVTSTSDQGTVNGEHFDHVMPVAMETSGGELNLQLGYNNGENPFEAAQRFINQNQLPSHHLQQIADWILARAGKGTPTLGGGGTSSASSAPAASSPSRSGSNGAGAGAGTGSVFAFTSQSFFVHADVPNAQACEKVLGKIRELNTAAGGESSALSLTAPELEALGGLLRVLVATSQYHVSGVTDAQINAVAKASKWEAPAAFPAFDIARMVALHPAGSVALSRHIEAAGLFARASAVAIAQPAVLPTILTSLRLLGNAFRHEDLRQRLLLETGHLSDFFVLAARSDLMAGRVPSSKPQRLALVNVAFNLSVHFVQSVARKPDAAVALASSGAITSCNELLRVVLATETESIDVALRALQALGMTCSTWLAMGGELVPASVVALKAAVAVAAGNWAGGNETAKQCAAEVQRLLV